MSTEENVERPTAATEPTSRETKKLPTYRVGFAKQMDALRAYAVLSQGGSAPVRYQKVAETIKVHESNVSSMNPFFMENGFVERTGTGFIPHRALLEFNRAYGWDANKAGAKLAPMIENTWFAQALVHKLGFRSMSEDEAIEVLAAECMAGPDAKQSLKVLIDFLEYSTIVERVNGNLKLKASADATGAPSRPASPVESVARDEPSPPPRQTAPTMASPTGAGAISFQVNVSVDMAEMKGWSPDRIASFFSGLAQVIAAQQKGSE